MYKPSENDKFGFESTEEDYDGPDGEKFLHSSQVAEYCKIGANNLKDAANGLKKAAAGFKKIVDVFDDAENFVGFLIDEYERALQNIEKLMKAVESLDKRLEALELRGGSPHLDRLEKLENYAILLGARIEKLEKTKHRKTNEFNVFIPNETPTACADGWRDLFRERPGFYEWVEAETFEGGRFKAFRADTNGNGDAWRDAELKPVSPPFRWSPLPSQKKARRDNE